MLLIVESLKRYKAIRRSISICLQVPIVTSTPTYHPTYECVSGANSIVLLDSGVGLLILLLKGIVEECRCSS